MEDFNKYFYNSDKDVFLITLLPPFYVQYFGNGHYQYLPMAENQEFGSKGKNYIAIMLSAKNDLLTLYEEYLRSGKKLFISNYYLVNYHGAMDNAFSRIEKKFALTQVSSGCLDLCKIYILKLKTK